MKIKWDKEVVTTEQKILAKYVATHSDIFVTLIQLDLRHNIFSLSVTPKPFKTGFYTYELKKDPSSDSYLILIWKGIRTGDAIPMLYGHIEDETPDNTERKNET